MRSDYNAPVSLTGILRFAIKQVAGGPRMLKEGDAAPEFEAVDHQGRPIRLRDLRGKKVVLWFYPKADTPG
jgi:peroxiredoxin